MSSTLRHLLRQPEMVVAAGAVLPIGGLICKHLGFKALYMGGSATEATYFGHPDLGLKTLSESVHLAESLVNATGLPVVCDAEAGFGNYRTLARAVKAFERAGVAAIQLEDQESPPRGPLVGTRHLLSRQRAVGQVKAALDARSDDGLVIIARTDADELSVAEVIERCNLFIEAGADLVMPILFKVDGTPRQHLGHDLALEVLAKVRDNVSGPLAGVGFTELASIEEAANFGFKLYCYQADAHQATLASIYHVMKELKDSGSTANYFSQNPPLDPAIVREILDTERWLAIDDEQ